MATYKKINGFEICTPKLVEGGYDKDRYDHEQVEKLLSKIMSLDINARACHYKNKMVNLLSYQISPDADFIEGVFYSAKYGEQQEIIDVYTQITTGNKGKNEGVKNQMSFLLDKRNGLLLVQHDPEYGVTRDMLHRFFVNHSDLVEPYRESFNKINDPIKIPKNAYIKVAALPSKEFFEEIRNFARIREAFVLADLETGRSNEAIEYLRNEAMESDVEDFQQVKILLKNTITNGSIRHIEAFFKKLFDADKYDGYGVTGIYESGSSRTINMAKVPQTYDVEVTVNSNGIIDRSRLVEELIQIAKFDNPILEKNVGVEKVKEVGESNNEEKGDRED